MHTLCHPFSRPPAPSPRTISPCDALPPSSNPSPAPQPPGPASSQLQRMQLTSMLEGHEGCVNTVTFDPTGRLLVSGSDDQSIMIWNWEAGARGLEGRSLTDSEPGSLRVALPGARARGCWRQQSGGALLCPPRSHAQPPAVRTNRPRHPSPTVPAAPRDARARLAERPPQQRLPSPFHAPHRQHAARQLRRRRPGARGEPRALWRITTGRGACW
jgi:hypothetical protein